MLQRLMRHWWRVVGLACILGAFWPVWKGAEVARRWDERMAEIDERWNANTEQVRPELEVLRRARTETEQLESALRLATLQAEKVQLRREEVEAARELFADRGDYHTLFVLLWGVGFNVLWIGPFVSRVRARWRRRGTGAASDPGTDRGPAGGRGRGAGDAAGEGRPVEEAEWLEGSDPAAMLEEAGLASERKLRLFAAACCRRVWEHLPGAGSRRAVEVAERYADGEATPEELDAAGAGAEPYASPGRGPVHVARHAAGRSVDAWACADSASLLRAESLAPSGEGASGAAGGGEADGAESAAQADLLRCIFGNPYRPAALDPAWLTPTVTTLAAEMYESRDFSSMPVLADALQDAGCDDEDVLAHCRGPGPHVRGCWVVDLILGRE